MLPQLAPVPPNCQLGEDRMRFGVFDHMDSNSRPLGEQYEERLKLIDTYDRVGFYAYHLAEHHATPLGMAPSPSVFLAAVAQRTKRLRFGPLVYVLSLQNPIRAYEDICMLDQMSGGRLELGLGRGISPIEIGHYGVDPNVASSIYREAAAIVMKAFTANVLSFRGKHFRFDNTPIEITCVQRPHPPLWVGIGKPDSVQHAAMNAINMACNDTPARVRQLTDLYREQWTKLARHPKDLPIMGMNLHVVVADTEVEAMKFAKPAYEHWYASFHHLWNKHGVMPPNRPRPHFEDAIQTKVCAVGTPHTVAKTVRELIDATGINYLLCRFAFGNKPPDSEILRAKITKIGTGDSIAGSPYSTKSDVKRTLPVTFAAALKRPSAVAPRACFSSFSTRHTSSARAKTT
jgi:alkanesulfonate monooxygenase SsuD/methylene tetrahydromethanopterin reductase-like flavin-dependent oxidoreductase (luciferase family)